jgi:restriction system protein
MMELPTRVFVTLMVVGTIGVLALTIAGDILTKRPSVFLTALAPVLFIAFFVGLYWIAVRERLLRRRRLAQVSSAHQLWALMPDEMADVATELFRLEGYVVTENKRPDLSDGGVDFEVAKDHKVRLVQVKHWRQEVGVKEVRELWGIVAGEAAAGGVLIGTSGFTVAAREFADGKELELVDGAEFMRLRARHPHPGSVSSGSRDPLVSQGFEQYLTTLHRPACNLCKKPMVVVTNLRDASVATQFWGCPDYPRCKGLRRFSIPYIAPETPLGG